MQRCFKCALLELLLRLHVVKHLSASIQSSIPTLETLKNLFSEPTMHRQSLCSCRLYVSVFLHNPFTPACRCSGRLKLRRQRAQPCGGTRQRRTRTRWRSLLLLRSHWLANCWTTSLPRRCPSGVKLLLYNNQWLCVSKPPGCFVTPPSAHVRTRPPVVKQAEHVRLLDSAKLHYECVRLPLHSRTSACPRGCPTGRMSMWRECMFSGATARVC